MLPEYDKKYSEMFGQLYLQIYIKDLLSDTEYKHDTGAHQQRIKRICRYALMKPYFENQNNQTPEIIKRINYRFTRIAVSHACLLKSASVLYNGTGGQVIEPILSRFTPHLNTSPCANLLINKIIKKAISQRANNSCRAPDMGMMINQLEERGYKGPKSCKSVGSVDNLKKELLSDFFEHTVITGEPVQQSGELSMGFKTFLHICNTKNFVHNPELKDLISTPMAKFESQLRTLWRNKFPNQLPAQPPQLNNMLPNGGSAGGCQPVMAGHVPRQPQPDPNQGFGLLDNTLPNGGSAVAGQPNLTSEPAMQPLSLGKQLIYHVTKVIPTVIKKEPTDPASTAEAGGLLQSKTKNLIEAWIKDNRGTSQVNDDCSKWCEQIINYLHGLNVNVPDGAASGHHGDVDLKGVNQDGVAVPHKMSADSAFVGGLRPIISDESVTFLEGSITPEQARDMTQNDWLKALGDAEAIGQCGILSFNLERANVDGACGPAHMLVYYFDGHELLFIDAHNTLSTSECAMNYSQFSDYLDEVPIFGGVFIAPVAKSEVIQLSRDDIDDDKDDCTGGNAGRMLGLNGTFSAKRRCDKAPVNASTKRRCSGAYDL